MFEELSVQAAQTLITIFWLSIAAILTAAIICTGAKSSTNTN